MGTDIATPIMTLGFFGSVVTMLAHIFGVALGWWGASGPTWWIALTFLATTMLATTLGQLD